MKEDYRYVETGRKKGTVLIVITPHESHYRDANPIIQQPALMIYGDQDMIPKQGGRR